MNNIAAFDDRPENVLSFNKPISDNDEGPPYSTNKRWKMIWRHTYIDKFTTKSERVRLTPSVCDVCAFDIAAKNHGGWDNVPEHKRSDVIQALEEHKKEEHPIKQDHIIDDDQMPTEWLGGRQNIL